jgi:hypothetical protein
LQKYKKIETYITNTTHLIDEAEAMQTNAERYKFRYYALRQEISFSFLFSFLFSLSFLFLFSLYYLKLIVSMTTTNYCLIFFASKK